MVYGENNGKLALMCFGICSLFSLEELCFSEHYSQAHLISQSVRKWEESDGSF